MASEKGLNSATPERPTIDYKQPDSSPYEDPFVTLLIGRKEYAVPRCYLRAYPQFQMESVNGLYVRLLDIEEDIGHTVIHFLYTGRYETLNPTPSKGIYDIPKEFRRSVQVYRAALAYGIHGLEALAKRYIEILSHSVSIYYILDTARTVFSKIPGNGVWIRDYLYTQLKRAFCLDERIFDHDELYKALGNDLSFTETVIKMIFTIYNDTISSLRSLRCSNEQMQDVSNRQVEPLADLHAAKERPSEVCTVNGKQQPEQEQLADWISVQEGRKCVKQYLAKDPELCEDNMEGQGERWSQEEDPKDQEEHWDQEEGPKEHEEHWDQEKDLKDQEEHWDQEEDPKDQEHWEQKEELKDQEEHWDQKDKSEDQGKYWDQEEEQNGEEDKNVKYKPKKKGDKRKKSDRRGIY